MSPDPKRWWEPAARITIVAALVYGGIIGFFGFREDALLYFPRKGLRSADELGLIAQRVELTTTDSVKLVGWAMPHAVDSLGVWVLYFHGNGGNISSRSNAAHYTLFHELGMSVFAIDYRGYGESESEPSEEGLYLDAAAAFHYLSTQRGIPTRNIVLYGFSLGAAVAVHLASHVEAGAIVLEGAFTSAPDVGDHHYPFLPIHIMMRNRYDSMSKMAAVAEPKLFLHAREDDIVPLAFGERLYEASPPPKTFVATAGDHNTLLRSDRENVRAALKRFLDKTMY